jgi:chromosome segregation ATPase
MVATAYPGGGGPPKVMEAIENIWRMAAATTRLDGELQAEAKRNENLERRGREFTAQVGRRIEDLSREHSRLKREIAAATVDLTRLREDYQRANQELVRARETIATIDKGRDEMTDDLRRAYEMAGAAAARRQGRAEAVAKVEAKIKKWQDDCERIEAQLGEYREQLDRHSSSIEGDLEGGRQRLATKVQQRQRYSEMLAASATFLADHFRGKSECAPLYEELDELDRSSVVADVEDPLDQPQLV